jgi:hypothetical protein
MPSPSSTTTTTTQLPSPRPPPAVPELLRSYDEMITDKERMEREARAAALDEGLGMGLLTLSVTLGTFLVAKARSQRFMKLTNWQSRTALIIMPPLFMYQLTTDQTYVLKMQQLRKDTDHSIQTVYWANEQIKKRKKNQQGSSNDTSESDVASSSSSTLNADDTVGAVVPADDTMALGETLQLHRLYQMSIDRDENVTIVPGDKLQWYHRFANFVANNPVKVLVSLSVPAVGVIFFGNQSKAHLPISRAILQTRVVGQFATICVMVGVISFKEFMNTNGRYISQAEASARLEEMQRIHDSLTEQLRRKQEQPPPPAAAATSSSSLPTKRQQQNNQKQVSLDESQPASLTGTASAQVEVE